MKRNELLIKSLKYVDKKYKLLIAGKGKDEENLRKLVEKEGQSQRVQFLGYISDEELIDYYAHSSLIYFAPKDEDYGYITIEAFKSSKPVVTTNDSGGVLEFVKHNKSGLVLNPDPKEIGTEMNKLLNNQSLLKQYGQNGHEIVSDINWDFVIEELTKSLK
ncbi:glycosyltransferase [Cohnella ginsengisoli]|uniref:Glycosyltransferase n=1 Tax=Cohnella ginsengisoli TaxID=425004 RepID=A0A9X4KM76_9BACL|nr:glycosyltransferase [Cohnella ginsengisoli]MDG0794531.1 glycosyltransferase [Cohnella ginsengisoli]